MVEGRFGYDASTSAICRTNSHNIETTKRDRDAVEQSSRVRHGHHRAPFMSRCSNEKSAGKRHRLLVGSKNEKSIPVMIIAWGECMRFGVNDSLAHWDLRDKIPRCYSPAKSVNPQSWTTRYGDFEHLADRRQVPGICCRQQCDFPVNCESGWVELDKMRVFDPDRPHTLYEEAVVEAMMQ